MRLIKKISVVVALNVLLLVAVIATGHLVSYLLGWI